MTKLAVIAGVEKDAFRVPSVASKKETLLSRRTTQYLSRTLLFLVFCAVWYALVEGGVIDKFFVSQPVDIAKFLLKNFWSEIVPNTAHTMLATLIAFFLSAVAGMLAGLALAEMPRLHSLLDPFLVAFNSLPRIALAPIFILWFGIGVTSKVALAFSLGFFIVLSSTMAGMRNIDPILLRLSRSLGCTVWQQFTKIMLPWAVPTVFAGLRLSLIYSFLGVVTSEMLASRVGLGQLIMGYSGTFQIDAVMGILFVMAVCSVALSLVTDIIESALLADWTETPGGAQPAGT